MSKVRSSIAIAALFLMATAAASGRGNRDHAQGSHEDIFSLQDQAA